MHWGLDRIDLSNRFRNINRLSLKSIKMGITHPSLSTLNEIDKQKYPTLVGDDNLVFPVSWLGDRLQSEWRHADEGQP